MEFDITGNLKLNTEQATQDLNRFVNHTNNPRFAQTSNIDTMNSLNNNGTDNQLGDDADYLSDNFTALKDEIKKVLESFKSLSVTLDQTESKYRENSSGGGSSKPRKDGYSTDPDVRRVQEARGVIGATGTVAQNYINGNYGGALLSGTNSLSSGFSSLSKYQRENGNADNADALAKAASGIAIAGAVIAIENSLANAYSNSLDNSVGLLRNFGNISAFKGTNNITMARMRSDALGGSLDTGLSSEEYLSLLNSQSAYGIGDYSRAKNLATRIGKWSNYTGADTSVLSSYAGLVERFGGNGANALDIAYSAATAQGLEKGQFGEFLSGLQSVIENGIAKGFVKSEEDISAQLTYFTQLSGNNALWEGKYGANRLNQMINAGERNLSMSNSGQMLLWQATKSVLGENASTEDIYKYVLSGEAMIDPQVLSNFYKLVTSTTGDRMSQMKLISQILDNNDALAFNLLDMLPDIGSMTKDQIKNTYNTSRVEPELKTNQTDMQNTKNETNEFITNAGRVAAEANNTVGKVLNFIAPGGVTKELQDAYETMGVLRYTNAKTGETEYYDHELSNEEKKDLKKRGFKRDSVVNSSIVEDEANNKYASQQEIDFYNKLKLLEKSGINTTEYQNFLNGYASAINGENRKEGYTFDNDKLDALLLTMDSILELMKEGITTE